jgi:hypothetical protein
MPRLWKAWKAESRLPTVSTGLLEISPNGGEIPRFPQLRRRRRMEKWKTKESVTHVSGTFRYPCVASLRLDLDAIHPRASRGANLNLRAARNGRPDQFAVRVTRCSRSRARFLQKCAASLPEEYSALQSTTPPCRSIPKGADSRCPSPCDRNPPGRASSSDSAR